MADEQQTITETDSDSIESNLDDVMASLTPTATERLRDDTGKFVARQTESEADPQGDAEDAAPAEEPTSGETEQETEPEQVPTIDPPRFWNAQERAVWDSLTPQAKEIILAKETERDATTSRERNEAAEARKKYEAEATTAAQERQRYVETLAALTQYAQTMDPVIAEGQRTDWKKLSEEDPAGAQTRWFEFQQRRGTLQAVQAELNRVGSQQASEAREARRNALSQSLPDFADEAKAKAVRDSIAPVLLDAGFSQSEIAAIWDEVPDARHVRIVLDAVEARKMREARKTLADKKAAPKPVTVQKPRAADQSRPVNNRVEALRKNAEKSRRIGDMADFITASLMEGTRQ